MNGMRILTLGFLVSLMVLAGAVTATGTGVFPVPVETIQPPANLSIGVQLNQEGTQIMASFRGGFGQNLLKDIQISVIAPDGTVQNKSLGWNTGDTVTFTGTGCGDQVTGTAIYMNNVAYPFLNEMMPYLNGVCSAGYKPASDPCEEIAASPSLKPDPIQEIPANKSVAIQVNVDISTIDVEYRGGFGQNIMKSLEVTRYSPDGSKETKPLDNRVGSTISFKATNGCMERIGADVIFMDGTMYHFYDNVIHISRTY
ncbi:MAG: hypothetical protein CVV33_04540 [Methanomicrobiales archaeon HGW-Methanomicrobiales-4]|nr:MAG: hypothetical protein CVV33_04540 [Methanomicrobiales archaeon HGW-Methanomicrobiales-4]